MYVCVNVLVCMLYIHVCIVVLHQCRIKMMLCMYIHIYIYTCIETCNAHDKQEVMTVSL